MDTMGSNLNEFYFYIKAWLDGACTRQEVLQNLARLMSPEYVVPVSHLAPIGNIRIEERPLSTRTHTTEPINAVLISGEIDRQRMYRALGEVADIAAAGMHSQNPVVVVDSIGGRTEPTYGFLDSVLDDVQTRRSLEQTDVKIYNAQSGAAIIALSIGQRRTMAAGTQLGIHLPLTTVDFDGVGTDGRLHRHEGTAHVVERILRLMSRYGLDGTEQRSQMFSTGWLHLPANECRERGLVSELFRLESGDASSADSRCPPSGPMNGDSSPVRVILISGMLTKAVLDRALLEMRDIAACSNEDEEVTFLVDSSEGEMFSIDEFLESVQREPQLKRLAETASVKIYCAQVGAALWLSLWGVGMSSPATARWCSRWGVLSSRLEIPSTLIPTGVSPWRGSSRGENT